MLKKWKVFWGCFFLFSVAIFLLGCEKDSSKEKKQKKTNVIVVQPRSDTANLFYTGTLEPLKTLSVFSPVNGRVHHLYFQYGDKVQKGEKLVTLSSEKLVESYRQAVSDYLTKKATYINGIQTYQGNIALHDAGVISDSEFINDRNTYETNLLSFYQSRFALEKVLKQAGMDPKEVEALSLNDTKKLNSILEKHFKNIVISAPGSGVALFPIQSNTDSSDSSTSGGSGGKLVEGANVNQDQLLLSVGDLSGLSVQLTVSEIDINRIKVGLPAIITGDGFPGVTLQGKVTEVSSQADPNDTGGDSGLSMFTVQVIVPSISDKDRKVIRVGMTSKVQIEIKSPAQIKIPMNAVKTREGKTQVQVLKGGKPVWVTVQTGQTSVDSIQILQGLKTGDKVVVDE